MKILDFLIELFKKKNLLIFILTAAIALLILLNLKSCGDLRNQNAKDKQNEEAMKKELAVEKNNSGYYQTSAVAFEGSVKEVQKYSDSLAKDIEDLKHRKPSVIIQTKLIYEVDTLYMNSTLINEGKDNYGLAWDFTSTDSSRIIKGISSFNAKVNLEDNNGKYSLKILPGKTELLKDELKIDLVVGVAKNKKTNFDEIFVTPKNPNVHVNTLEGAILNKKKQNNFSLSAQLGYGIVYGKQNLTFGPYIGVGLSYNLLGWLSKK